jgi:hypothetical protein
MTSRGKPVAMDEDAALGYNKDVEAFRELEYPMLKGQPTQFKYEVLLISGYRCCLSRSCRDNFVFEVAHGEIHD